MENIQVTAPAMANKREVVIAAGLSALAIAAIALPVATVKAMGFSTGLALVSPLLLGGTVYLLPLVFLAGLAARFAPQAQPYVRLLEIAGLVVAAGVALYAIVTMLNGISEMNSMNAQMNQMLGSANARQFSSMGGVSVGSGTFALALLLAGSVFQVWLGRKSR